MNLCQLSQPFFFFLLMFLRGKHNILPFRLFFKCISAKKRSAAGNSADPGDFLLREEFFRVSALAKTVGEEYIM